MGRFLPPGQSLRSAPCSFVPCHFVIRTVLKVQLFSRDPADGISCFQEVSMRKGFSETPCVMNETPALLMQAGGPALAEASLRTPLRGHWISGARHRLTPAAAGGPLLGPSRKYMAWGRIGIVLVTAAPTGLCTGWVSEGVADVVRSK